MPGYIAVFAIFEADAAAIEIGYVIGVAAVSIGNESVGTWQVEDTQRLAYYLVNDVVITSVKAGSVEAGKTLVFGGGNQFAMYIPLRESNLFCWKVMLALMFSSMSCVFNGVMPMAISRPLLRMEPIFASRVL